MDSSCRGTAALRLVLGRHREGSMQLALTSQEPVGHADVGAEELHRAAGGTGGKVPGSLFSPDAEGQA